MNEIVVAFFVGLAVFYLARLVRVAENLVAESIMKHDGKWKKTFLTCMFYSALFGYMCYLPAAEKEGGDGLYSQGDIVAIEQTSEKDRKLRGFAVFFLGMSITVSSIRSWREIVDSKRPRYLSEA